MYFTLRATGRCPKIFYIIVSKFQLIIQYCLRSKTTLVLLFTILQFRFKFDHDYNSNAYRDKLYIILLFKHVTVAKLPENSSIVFVSRIYPSSAI